MNTRIFLLLLVGLFSNLSSAFTFTITVVDETCPNNASLTFNVSGGVAGGTMSYLIYKLPNLTTPFSTQTSNVLNTIGPGTYRVIATETVGGVVSAPQQLEATVATTYSSLTYDFINLNSGCAATTSTVNVNVLTGTAVSYSIIAGPILFPAQTSNSFPGLTAGTYKFSVLDSCGNGLVLDYTVILSRPVINIANVVLTETVPPNCATINVNNIITPGGGSTINYPLIITYTVNPPVGAPIVIVQNVASGSATSQNITQTIPFYINQAYSYSIQITDNCGTVHPVRSFPIVNDITITAVTGILTCTKLFFQVDVKNFTPPFTLSFLTAPPGFSAANANTSYPGPYNTILPIIFEYPINSIELGNYDIQVTDACGKIANFPFIVSNIILPPSGVGVSNGCTANNGNITVTPLFPRKLLTATVISCTNPAYTVPSVVTANIDINGVLNLLNVPLGDYVISVLDDCGQNSLVPVSILKAVDKKVRIINRPGCDLNKGSFLVQSFNGKITSFKITAAPPGFVVPYDGIANIAANGFFTINDVPPGNYTMEIIDECNFTNILTGTAGRVIGYAETTKIISHTANCGSFNIPINYVTTANSGVDTFWLQREISPGVWGHPATGSVFATGTFPNTTNSIRLQNSLTANVNYAFNGNFRVVRDFLIYNNGSDVRTGLPIDKHCLDLSIYSFSFNEKFEILEPKRISCTSNSSNKDVIIIANGKAPITYSVTDSLGNVINNGTSNIFYNLPNGLYTFRVSDGCGSFKSVNYDITTMASLVVVSPTQDDIVKCATNITGTETFDLTSYNAKILGGLLPVNYTVTYFNSKSNAELNTNSIPTVSLAAYDPPGNNFTIYARVIFNQLPSCYELSTFKLIVGQEPPITLASRYQDCSIGSITIDGSVGSVSGTKYLWSDGVNTATTPTFTVNKFGISTVSLTKTVEYGSIKKPCSTTKTTEVVISKPPKFDHIETIDWTESENAITVFTTAPGNFEYSIDGSNFQDDNYFGNLTPGLYKVYIKDKNNCGTTISPKDVWLLYYPKFFTPNGDGFNDYWNIPNSVLEKEFKVIIYDRYGKMMTSFFSKNLGWDGRYNGLEMPSDDYWFYVYRQDGRFHKGHFSMKR